MTRIEYFDLWFSRAPGEYEDFGRNRNIQTVYQVSLGRLEVFQAGDIEVPFCVWSAPSNRTARQSLPGVMSR